jgi:aryl-alcohol dehydrogenase-like predicted oxidoreductase
MSLRRLGVERIDLWQLHRIDPLVPRDEQFDVIRAMQSEGLIRHVGLSEVSVDEVTAAQKYFDVVSVQNLYNVANRASEELLAHSTANGIGFIPWFPLGNRELVSTDGPLGAIAARLECTPSQVALAWLLQHSPVMLPIPGTGSLAHLDENCGGAVVELDAAAVSELNALATA